MGPLRRQLGPGTFQPAALSSPAARSSVVRWDEVEGPGSQLFAARPPSPPHYPALAPRRSSIRTMREWSLVRRTRHTDCSAQLDVMKKRTRRFCWHRLGDAGWSQIGRAWRWRRRRWRARRSPPRREVRVVRHSGLRTVNPRAKEDFACESNSMWVSTCTAAGR